MALRWDNMRSVDTAPALAAIDRANQGVSSGVAALQGVAQNYANEQRRADTGDVLASIGSLDQTGLDSFNTDSLGRTVDKLSVADALNNRRGQLKSNPQDQLAQLRLTQAQQQEAKNATLSTAREELRLGLEGMDNSSNVQDLAYDISKKYGLSEEESQLLASGAGADWTARIDVRPEQQEFIDQGKAAKTAEIQNYAQQAKSLVDAELAPSGILGILGFANDTSLDLNDVYGQLKRDNDYFNDEQNEGSKNILSDDGLSRFAKEFKEAFPGKALPTGAEAMHILSQAISLNSFTDGGGLDEDSISAAIKEYKETVNSDAARSYQKELDMIQQRANKALKQVEKDEQSFRAFARNVNRGGVLADGVNLRNSGQTYSDLTSILFPKVKKAKEVKPDVTSVPKALNPQQTFNVPDFTPTNNVLLNDQFSRARQQLIRANQNLGRVPAQN